MRPTPQPIDFSASGGMILVQLALFITLLLGFLGVAIYFGLSGMLQNEVQKATNMAALAGASAFYDGPSTGIPVSSPPQAQQSATTLFNRVVATSPMLQSMTTTLSAVSLGADTVTVTAQASLPTNFLAPIGINQFTIQAKSEARAAKEVIATAVLLNPGASVVIPLKQPLLDGPGPDLHIIANSPSQGYIVEACAGPSDCYNLDNAAVGGQIGYGGNADATVNGSNIRIVHGEQYIDLGASQANYNGYVKKASQLKITDDGMDDFFIGNQRALFLKPPPSNVIQLVEVYHHATLCQDDTCLMPSGFSPMP